MNWEKGQAWTLIFWLVWILPESAHKLIRQVTKYTLVRVRDEAHRTVGFFWEKRYRLRTDQDFLDGDPDYPPLGVLKPE